MSASETDADASDTGEPAASSGRDPAVDRVSTAVAVTAFVLLATNDAPPLADVGTVAVVAAAIGVGAVAAIVLFRLFGPVVRGPLWIGVGTAVFLWLPVVVVLLISGRYTAELGWIVSVVAAVFGLGVSVRALRARLEYERRRRGTNR